MTITRIILVIILLCTECLCSPINYIHTSIKNSSEVIESNAEKKGTIRISGPWHSDSALDRNIDVGEDSYVKKIISSNEGINFNKDMAEAGEMFDVNGIEDFYDKNAVVTYEVNGHEIPVHLKQKYTPQTKVMFPEYSRDSPTSLTALSKSTTSESDKKCRKSFPCLDLSTKGNTDLKSSGTRRGETRHSEHLSRNIEKSSQKYNSHESGFDDEFTDLKQMHKSFHENPLKQFEDEVPNTKSTYASEKKNREMEEEYKKNDHAENSFASERIDHEIPQRNIEVDKENEKLIQKFKDQGKPFIMNTASIDYDPKLDDDDNEKEDRIEDEGGKRVSKDHHTNGERRKDNDNEYRTYRKKNYFNQITGEFEHRKIIDEESAKKQETYDDHLDRSERPRKFKDELMKKEKTRFHNDDNDDEKYNKDEKNNKDKFDEVNMIHSIAKEAESGTQRSKSNDESDNEHRNLNEETNDVTNKGQFLHDKYPHGFTHEENIILRKVKNNHQKIEDLPSYQYEEKDSHFKGGRFHKLMDDISQNELSPERKGDNESPQMKSETRNEKRKPSRYGDNFKENTDDKEGSGNFSEDEHSKKVETKVSGNEQSYEKNNFGEDSKTMQSRRNKEKYENQIEQGETQDKKATKNLHRSDNYSGWNSRENAASSLQDEINNDEPSTSSLQEENSSNYISEKKHTPIKNKFESKGKNPTKETSDYDREESLKQIRHDENHFIEGREENNYPKLSSTDRKEKYIKMKSESNSYEKITENDEKDLAKGSNHIPNESYENSKRKAVTKFRNKAYSENKNLHEGNEESHGDKTSSLNHHNSQNGKINLENDDSTDANNKDITNVVKTDENLKKEINHNNENKAYSKNEDQLQGNEESHGDRISSLNNHNSQNEKVKLENDDSTDANTKDITNDVKTDENLKQGIDQNKENKAYSENKNLHEDNEEGYGDKLSSLNNHNTQNGKVNLENDDSTDANNKDISSAVKSDENLKNEINHNKENKAYLEENKDLREGEDHGDKISSLNNHSLQNGKVNLENGDNTDVNTKDITNAVKTDENLKKEINHNKENKAYLDENKDLREGNEEGHEDKISSLSNHNSRNGKVNLKNGDNKHTNTKDITNAKTDENFKEEINHNKDNKAYSENKDLDKDNEEGHGDKISSLNNHNSHNEKVILENDDRTDANNKDITNTVKTDEKLKKEINQNKENKANSENKDLLVGNEEGHGDKISSLNSHNSQNGKINLENDDNKDANKKEINPPNGAISHIHNSRINQFDDGHDSNHQSKINENSNDKVHPILDEEYINIKGENLSRLGSLEKQNITNYKKMNNRESNHSREKARQLLEALSGEKSTDEQLTNTSFHDQNANAQHGDNKYNSNSNNNHDNNENNEDHVVGHKSYHEDHRENHVHQHEPSDNDHIAHRSDNNDQDDNNNNQISNLHNEHRAQKVHSSDNDHGVTESRNSNSSGVEKEQQLSGGNVIDHRGPGGFSKSLSRVEGVISSRHEIGKGQTRSSTPVIIKKDKAEYPDYNEVKDAAVFETNLFRKRYHDENLNWSDKLSDKAQEVAENIAKKGDVSPAKLDEYKIPGQNVALVKFDVANVGKEAIDTWSKESTNYDFKNPLVGIKNKDFVQLVWKNEKQFGIGVAKSKSSDEWIVVSMYDTPYSEKNEDLVSNVFADKSNDDPYGDISG